MVDSRFFFNILFLTVELQNELLCHFVGQVKAIDTFLFPLHDRSGCSAVLQKEPLYIFMDLFLCNRIEKRIAGIEDMARDFPNRNSPGTSFGQDT